MTFPSFMTTRSYAALRAADLDWIVWPGYSLGRYILGCSQRLASCLQHSAWIGPDPLCYPSSVTCHPSSAIRRPSSVTHHPSSIVHRPTGLYIACSVCLRWYMGEKNTDRTLTSSAAELAAKSDSQIIV